MAKILGYARRGFQETTASRYVLAQAAVRFRAHLSRRQGPVKLRADDGQTGMYGPPLCRKRKTKVTGWSAQMYSAFVEHRLLALDGMRCALVLLSNAALE